MSIESIAIPRKLTFEEHERDWKRRHRASIPRRKRVVPIREYFWILFWVIVAIGAAIYSAAHTIPAALMTIFGNIKDREELAKTVFIIVELVIFGAAAGRHEIKWLRWLMLAAILVALVANVGSSIQAVYENGGNWLNQIGGVLTAIIAPITAFAAGEVLHIQLDKVAVKIKKAADDYSLAWRDVEAKINQSYSKYEKEYAAKYYPVLPVQPLNEQNEQPKQARKSPKMEQAIAWLSEHPEHLETPSRELVEQIGDMSHVIIFNAQKYLKSQNGNGHHGG